MGGKGGQETERGPGGKREQETERGPGGGQADPSDSEAADSRNLASST